MSLQYTKVIRPALTSARQLFNKLPVRSCTAWPTQIRRQKISRVNDNVITCSFVLDLRKSTTRSFSTVGYGGADSNVCGSEAKHFKADRWEQFTYKESEEHRPVISGVALNTHPGELLNAVSVQWEDGNESVYPFVYLRDCCTCDQCLHPDIQQRLGDIASHINTKIDSLVKPGKVSFVKEGQMVKVEWEDGHESNFTANWLWRRRLPREQDLLTNQKTQNSKFLWGSELAGCLPQVDFQDFESTDHALYFFLNCLQQAGIVVIKNAPCEANVLQEVSKRLQTHIRRTHYGEIFTVMSKPDANSLAYTSDGIPLHIDLAYYRYQPGVQFLHCIEQSVDQEGGFSLVADGFHIAEVIRKNDPNIFELLSSTKFIFKDSGKDVYGHFKKTLARPIVEVDDNNNVRHIAFNNFTRSSFFDTSASKVQQAYRAYYYWEKELRNPKNVLKFKLVEGDILCFDNTRVLHGRTGFDPRLSSRWLEGCYIDWDELNSAMEVTTERLRESPKISHLGN